MIKKFIKLLIDAWKSDHAKDEKDKPIESSWIVFSRFFDMFKDPRSKWLTIRYKCIDKFVKSKTNTEAKNAEDEELNAFRRYIQECMDSDSSEIINEPSDFDKYIQEL